MADDFKTDQELTRLESMHERVQKLRSRLKELELDTYGALGIPGEEQHNDLECSDGSAK